MTSTRAALTIAVFALLAPIPIANAQIGGLIKKKVGEAVKGADKKETKAEAAKEPFLGNDASVIEITQPVLDGFKRGLQVEIALRKELRAEAAKYPTPEAYAACRNKAATSDEGMKIAQQMMNMPEKATDAQAMAIMTKAAKELGALQDKKCPFDPAVWQDGLAERLATIDRKAAEAAVPTSGSDIEPGSYESGVPDEEDALTESLRQDQHINVRRYNMLKERLAAFCESTKESRTTIGTVGIKFPGSSKTIFWVFTLKEVEVLTPQCEKLMRALEDLL